MKREEVRREKSLKPSPGGEGAARSEADEVEILRFCRKFLFFQFLLTTSSVGCAASFPSRGSLQPAVYTKEHPPALRDMLPL